MFCLFVLFFVLYETQINEPLIWVCERKGKFLTQAKGLIYPPSWCLYHEQDWECCYSPRDAGRSHFTPPPLFTLREIAYIAALPSVKTSRKWRGGMGTLRPPSTIPTATLRPPSNIPTGPCSLFGFFLFVVFLLQFFSLDSSWV